MMPRLAILPLLLAAIAVGKEERFRRHPGKIRYLRTDELKAKIGALAENHPRPTPDQIFQP